MKLFKYTSSKVTKPTNTGYGNVSIQRNVEPTSNIINNRPQAIFQRKLQEAINNNPKQIAQRQQQPIQRILNVGDEFFDKAFEEPTDVELSDLKTFLKKGNFKNFPKGLIQILSQKTFQNLALIDKKTIINKISSAAADKMGEYNYKNWIDIISKAQEGELKAERTFALEVVSTEHLLSDIVEKKHIQKPTIRPGWHNKAESAVKDFCDRVSSTIKSMTNIEIDKNDLEGIIISNLKENFENLFTTEKGEKVTASISKKSEGSTERHGGGGTQAYRMNWMLQATMSVYKLTNQYLENKCGKNINEELRSLIEFYKNQSAVEDKKQVHTK